MITATGLTVGKLILIVNKIGTITEMIGADLPTMLPLLQITKQDSNHQLDQIDHQMHQFHHHLGDMVDLLIHTTTITISPTTTMLTSIDNTM